MVAVLTNLVAYFAMGDASFCPPGLDLQHETNPLSVLHQLHQSLLLNDRIWILVPVSLSPLNKPSLTRFAVLEPGIGEILTHTIGTGLLSI